MLMAFICSCVHRVAASMALLSGSSVLRCACRAEKQILSMNTSRSTSILSSRLAATSFHTSAIHREETSSSSRSTSQIGQSQRFTRRSAPRARFVPPEDYAVAAPKTPSPIMAKLGRSDGEPRSSVFGIRAEKREASRAAKQAGAEFREERASADTEHTLPKSYATLKPIKPSDSRSLEVGGTEDFAKQYRRLMNGVINFNNIRTELRHQERYEKPKYKRQRLRSARHRRRFAYEVGLRVAAVLRAKSQGM